MMISIPGRIPIKIYPFFWILVVMLGWINSSTITGTAVWSFVIVCSVLIHEYGHALTAVFFRQKVEINLIGFGGVTKREGPKLPGWKEFLIVLNGPLAGFGLCALTYLVFGFVDPKNAILRYAFQVAINVNLFWTLLNLLPLLPLDGGHLMNIFFEGIFGIRGLKFALFISILLAVLIGVYFFFIQQVLMGGLFFMFAFESYRAYEDIKSVSPEDSSQDLQEKLKEGVEALKKGHASEALEKFIDIRQQAPKGVLYVTASQYGARILCEQGNFKKAYEWLIPLKNRLSFDYLILLQQLAYRLEDWEQAIKFGQQAFQQEPTTDVALINAFSYAILGEAVPSVGWLRSSVQLGLPNIKNIIEKREFDAIRESDAFKHWAKNF